MAAQSFENGPQKVLDFCKILKIYEKLLSTPYFLVLFYIVQREDDPR